MSNNFVNAIEKEIAWKLTENGLDALNTTFDKCLDLFATIGALRIRSDAEIQDKEVNVENVSRETFSVRGRIVSRETITGREAPLPQS